MEEKQRITKKNQLEQRKTRKIEKQIIKSSKGKRKQENKTILV